ncbi:MAG: hypothetical protein JW807_05850 [Spirochaetes bacterium]|nr:hypothetical protein [Spirochaetota bacterium]
MKLRYLALSLCMVISGSAARAAAVFEVSDYVKAGIRPLYAIVLGDYFGKYSHAPGFIAYARGGYQLNVDDKLLLYPELSWGFLYMDHESESGRRLMLFPFSISILFDASPLNFNTPAGTFVLKPGIGLGAYINDYRSTRTGATGCDFGFQVGINLEYTHVNMKNCYVEIQIDHLLTTNFNKTLPMLSFSVGAGYAFDMRKYKKRDAPTSGGL